MNKTEKVRIAYDGPLLASGEMDVKDLAPSLIAFADLVDCANKALGGQDKIKVMLNQDSIKAGSFDVTMTLDVDILRQAQVLVGMASDNGFGALMIVLGWCGVNGSSLGRGIFWLIKKINGRTLDNIIKHEDNKAEIVLNDGERIMTDQNTVKVLVDVNCRIHIEKVVQPVKEEGIDSFELRNPSCPNDKAPIVTIKKDDVRAFVAPPAANMSDKLLDVEPREYEMTVKISAVNFEKGNKWRLTDGNNTFWASIVDEGFLKRVDSGEISFTSGDMLKIRYIVRQSLKNGNLSSEYIVLEVLDIEKRPEQIKLNFKYKNTSDE